MTKERASATAQTRPAEPVTVWENENAKGQILCSEYLCREHIEKVEKLREQQAAYRASLPIDPPKVITAALDLIHPGGNSYPDGVEDALHLSYALEALVKYGDLAAQGGERDAALHIAHSLIMAMSSAIEKLDRISDILGNPDRVERGL